MRTVVATLESISPYSQSRYHETPKIDSKEPFEDYEARTWRNRLHVNEKGFVFIPPMQFKECLAEASKFLSEKIPGKRNSTYTKHFLAGILVTDALTLPTKKEDVPGETLFLNADGKKGSGTRVKRIMPCIQNWKGDVTFYVLDDTIGKEVFEHHLREAGNFIGIGRFRPRNGGFYGRFKVVKTAWND